MAPVEIMQTQQNQVAIPANQGGSISLSMLIDFIVQRTYHDLTVLAELYKLAKFNIMAKFLSSSYSRLPRKTDMERKIGT